MINPEILAWGRSMPIAVSQYLLESSLGTEPPSFLGRCIAKLLGQRYVMRSNLLKPEAVASADLNHIILMWVLFTTAEWPIDITTECTWSMRRQDTSLWDCSSYCRWQRWVFSSGGRFVHTFSKVCISLQSAHLAEKMHTFFDVLQAFCRFLQTFFDVLHMFCTL